MRTAQRVLTGLLFAGALMALPLPASTIPETIRVPDVDLPFWRFDRDVPLWVSAGVATEDSGALRAEYFKPYFRSGFGERIAQSRTTQRSQQGCDIEIYEAYHFTHGMRSSADFTSPGAAISSASQILIASVLDSEPGFLQGAPGTLFRVRSRDVIAGTSKEEYAYLYVPVARFSIAGAVVCMQPMGYRGLPSIGDEVVVFLDDNTMEFARATGIMYPHRVGLVTVAKGGAVSVSSVWEQGDLTAELLSAEGFLSFLNDQVEQVRGRIVGGEE